MVQSHYRYLINNNRPGTPGFLHYTPEQMLSFLLTKTQMMMFLYGKSIKIRSNQHNCIKDPVYNEEYSLEYRKKNNGFEKIVELDTYWRKILHEKMPHSDSVYLSSTQDMAKALWPKEMIKEYLNERSLL
jgi:Mn-containing catalase